MADKRSTSTVMCWLLAAALIVLSASVPAQDDALAGLPDPTRPDLGLSVEALLARDPDAKAELASLSNAKAGEVAIKLPPLLALEYTLVSKTRRIALINGVAVQEGEAVAGAQVLKIRPDQVTLSRDGQPLVLELTGYRKKVDESKKAGEGKTAASDGVALAGKEVPGEKGAKDGKK